MSSRHPTPRPHRALVLACLTLAPAFARADTATWTGTAADNLWATPTNWDPSTPNSATDVTLPISALPTDTTIDLGGSTRSINSLLFDRNDFGGHSYTLANGLLILNQITNASSGSDSSGTPQTIAANVAAASSTLDVQTPDGLLTLTGTVSANNLNYSNTSGFSQASLVLTNPSNNFASITLGSDQYYGAHLTAATPGALGTAIITANDGAALTFTGTSPNATTTYNNSIAISNAVNVRIAHSATPASVIQLGALTFTPHDPYAFFESNSNSTLAFSTTTLNGNTGIYSYTFESDSRAFMDLGSVAESSPNSSFNSYGFGTVTVSGHGYYTGSTRSSGGLLVAAQSDSFNLNPAAQLFAGSFGAIKFLVPQVPFHTAYVDPYGAIGGDLTGAIFSGPNTNVFTSDNSVFLQSATQLPLRASDTDHPGFLLGIESTDLSATVGEDPDQTSIFKGIALGAYTPYAQYTGTVDTHDGASPIDVLLNTGVWNLTGLSFDTANVTTGVHFQGIGEAHIGASHGSAHTFTATGYDANRYILSFADHQTLAPGETAHVSSGALFTTYPDAVADGATVNIQNFGTYVISSFDDESDGSPTTGTFNVAPGGAVYLDNLRTPHNITAGATFNFAPGSLFVIDAYGGTVDNAAPGSLPENADLILKAHNNTLTFSNPIALGQDRRITTTADDSATLSAPAVNIATGVTAVRLSAAQQRTLTIDAPLNLDAADLTVGDFNPNLDDHAFTTINGFTGRNYADQTGTVALRQDIVAHDVTVLSGDFNVGSFDTHPAVTLHDFNHNSTGATTFYSSIVNLSGSINQTDGFIFLNAPVNYAPGSSVTITGGYLNLSQSTQSTLADPYHQFTIGPAAIAYLNGPADPFSDSSGHTFNLQNDGALFIYAADPKLGAITGAGSTTLYGSTLTADSFRQSLLDIVAGTVITRPGGGNTVLKSLNIITANGGTLDLTDNHLILDYDNAAPSPIDDIRAYLRNARNTGAWTSAGLTAYPAVNDPQHRLAIGYAEASQLLNLAGPALAFYAGDLVDATTLLTKLTYYGDANLDGRVNADDYALIDRAFAKHLANPHWTDGDFNYDGIINNQDYLLIDRLFLQQTGTLAPTLLAQRESQFGPAYVSTLLASLPEPTSLLAACGLATSLLPRRQRR